MTLWQVHTMTIPCLSSKNSMAIYLSDNSLGLLGKGSELTLILGDPKECPGPSVGLGAYEDQVKNEVLEKMQLTMSPLDPQTHAVVTLPFPTTDPSNTMGVSWQGCLHWAWTCCNSLSCSSPAERWQLLCHSVPGSKKHPQRTQRGLLAFL